MLESVAKTHRLLVVHEDNATAGFGAEVVATVAEKSRQPVQCARLAREDVFIAYHFARQLEVLPSLKRVVETIARMLKMEVTWEQIAETDQDHFLVEALGASPADETVDVVEWTVAPGDAVSPGTILGVLEASKATMDLECPVVGVVEDILVPPESTVKVGTPILKVRLQNPARSKKPVSREDPGIPVFARHRTSPSLAGRGHVLYERRRNLFAGLASVCVAAGSRHVDNEEIVSRFPKHSAEEVLRLTGIESRVRLDDGETPLSLATAASEEALSKAGMTVADLDLLICATGTPVHASPSLGCMILGQLLGGKKELQIPAYDLSAACSGYLYGLLAAYDFLFAKPEGRVLLVTSEALSQKTDENDFHTAPLFGDAATASVLMGGAHLAHCRAWLYRPVIGAKPDVGAHLTVPLGFRQAPYVRMKGHRIFQEAVINMIAILRKACHAAAIPVEELDCIVPHQANQRIIDAIKERLPIAPDRVYSNIRNIGNTSSSSIPLCLPAVLETSKPGERIGMCAFGGGYTFGAGILELKN